ncbi:MAG TPA: DHH family phosphoesterase, partial [Haloplasmataceae bacterium]
IATDQEELIKLNDKAMEALEMTQNRGGDQVVLMVGNKTTKYFGGKTNVVEKRNRVRARVVARELQELIEEADKVIVMGHKIPDVDAFGSCIGIANIARVSGKDSFIVIDFSDVDNTLNKVLNFLKDNDSKLLKQLVSPNVALDLITANTLLVVVDTQNPNLVIEPKILNKAKKLVVIDHHRRGADYIESPDLIYTEMYASSSVELISELIEYYPTKIQLNEMDATVMLAGIIVDTNNFTYRTGSRTFEAASFLRKHGADTLAVQTMLRESYSEHLMRAMLFEKVEFTSDHMAIVVADNVGPLTTVKLAQTADWLLMIENVKASFVIGKLDEDTIGISSRSFGEVNVQLIMEKLGGGGHFNNAATQIKGITLEEAYARLNNSIHEYLKEMESDENHSTH